MIPAQKQPLRFEGEISRAYGLPLYEKVDIQQKILDAYAAGEKEITIPRGAYRITPREGANAHVILSDMHNFTINAYGVVFLYQNTAMGGLRIENSSEISVNGLTTDYEELIFTQCKLVEIGPERSYTVFEFDDGYGRFTQEDIEKGGTVVGPMCSSKTNFWVEGMERMVLFLDRIELLDGGKRFRYNLPLTTTDNRMEIGDYYCAKHVDTETGTAVVTLYSGSVHFKDVTVWGSPVSCISECYGEGGSTYENVRIVPGPTPYGASHPRLLSMSGDYFHLKALRKGPVLSNLYLYGSNDDAINVHGIYSAVDQVLAPNKLIIANHGKYDYRPGDTIRFYDKGVNRICTATVEASHEITADYTPETPLRIKLESAIFRVFYYHEVTLKTPVAVTRGDWVVNENAICAGFTLRDSVIFNICARGIGMKTSNALVENCVFDQCCMGGIRIMPEHDWMECDYSQNIVIRNNTFRRCGARNGFSANGLSINGHEAIEHRDILIENNVFEDNYNRDLHISCGRNITVRNNQFGAVHPTNQNLGREHNAVVHIDRSYGVTLENNTYTAPDRPVVVGPDTKDIKTDKPATLGSWSNLFIQGQQGRGGWHWQYAAVGSDEYHDFPIYDYDKRGWYTEDEANGCIRKTWWDTYMLPSPTTDVVKTYVCPQDGVLAMSTIEPIKAADLLDDTDGIRVCIRKNDAVLDWQEVPLFKPLPCHIYTVAVKAGDKIHFRVNHNQIPCGYTASWAPFVYYVE